MKNFVAIVKSTNGKLDKYQDFDTSAEADAHVAEHGGFVAPSPEEIAVGNTSYWEIDEAAKTVFFNRAQVDADVLASSWGMFRKERNTLLDSSDWTQYTDSPLDDEAKVDWVIYRQELRDLPATTDVPADPTWPEEPK